MYDYSFADTFVENHLSYYTLAQEVLFRALFLLRCGVFVCVQSLELLNINSFAVLIGNDSF